jgi:hypothetical protein
MSSPRLFFAVAIALLGSALGGCGNPGNHAKIHGKVTLDGAPMATGSIRFVPAPGTPGAITGGDIKDGQYEIAVAKGPAIGTNRVEIQSMRATGKRIHDAMLPPDQTAEVFENAVAPKFNSESTLEVQVKPGDNTADFDVQSP